MNKLPNIICEICGANNTIIYEEIQYNNDITYIECANCYNKIQLVQENIIIKNENFQENVPVLEKGTIVIITNKQHPWHGQIGVINDKKHKHYRIEILGKLLWVPENWVKENE